MKIHQLYAMMREAVELGNAGFFGMTSMEEVVQFAPHVALAMRQSVGAEAQLSRLMGHKPSVTRRKVAEMGTQLAVFNMWEQVMTFDKLGEPDLELPFTWKFHPQRYGTPWVELRRKLKALTFPARYGMTGQELAAALNVQPTATPDNRVARLAPLTPAFVPSYSGLEQALKTLVDMHRQPNVVPPHRKRGVEIVLGGDQGYTIGPITEPSAAPLLPVFSSVAAARKAIQTVGLDRIQHLVKTFSKRLEG